MHVIPGNQPSPLLATKHQLLLDDEDFVKQHQPTLQEGDLRELAITHKYNQALSLADYAMQTDPVLTSWWKLPIIWGH